MVCPHCEAEVPDGNRFCNNCGRTVTGEDDPLIGRTIAEKYLVGTLLGSGGMGRIYNATHVALDRRVALKVLHPELTKDQSLVERFMREARAASRLSHPNIVTLLDFGQEPSDGLLYIVMEFLEGKSLAGILESEEAIATPRALGLARQILLAIDEAHQHGVVHRDLKPENIIVIARRQGQELAKVVDFGLAQIRGGADDPRLTSTGLVCGTPSYLSPEQAHGAEITHATDIYSFGVILFELITGKPPFTGSSPWVLVSKHMNEPPPHPATISPGRPVSEALASVILRCLEKTPARRFPTAMAVHEALAGITGAERPEPRRAAPPAHLMATARPDEPTAAGAPPPGAVPLLPGALPMAAGAAPTAQWPPPSPIAQTWTPSGAAASVCPSCAQPTPPGARFCAVCGAPLGPRCGCGNICRPGERFCPSCGGALQSSTDLPAAGTTSAEGGLVVCAGCGSPLAPGAPCPRCSIAGAPEDPALAQLRRFVPRGVLDAFVRAEPELLAQRREVTVLFAEVEGLSQSSELDPEDAFRLMSTCYEALSSAITRFGGTVDKFISDSLMAVFGAPISHEDDPERAVRAALAMKAAVDELRAKGAGGLDLRVGIHTGPVVAGAVRSSVTSLSFALIGETVDTAQRLGTSARQGKILVSEGTFFACRQAVKFKPAKGIQIKGAKRRVAVFEVQELALEAETSAPVLALVGRAEERRLLEEAGRAAAAGSGAALLLGGEPGIGKSALLLFAAGVFRQLGLKPHLVRARRHTPEPGALGLLVRSMLGCTVSSTEPELRKALSDLLAALPGALDAADQSALLNAMGVESHATIPGEILNLTAMTALRRLTRARASKEPLAILIDDARHLSPRERSLLGSLAGIAHETALVLALADRGPDYGFWRGTGFRVIELGPLHPSDSERLVQRLAGGRDIEPQAMERILRASGGNPLYLAETTRYLDQGGRLSPRSPREQALPTSGLPDGLRSLITSRFDGLEPPLKMVLIYASVLGASFDLQLLQQLGGDPALKTRLEALRAMGILEADPEAEQPRWRFRHEIVREVVYDLITRKVQQSIHDQVATTLLKQYEGTAQLSEVSHHLERAGRDAEAADWLERAGELSLGRHETSVAADQYGRAVGALDRALSKGTASKEADLQRSGTLRIKLARALNEAQRWSEAQPIALEARGVALKIGDTIGAARATRELARIAAEQGTLQAADSLLAEAYDGAMAAGDLDLAAEVASDLGEIRERAGNLPEALQTLSGALKRLQAAAQRAHGQDEIATAVRLAEVLNRIGRVLLRERKPDEAAQVLQAALERARAAGESLLAARVLGNLGQAQAASGQAEVAQESLEMALHTSQSVGDRLASAKLLHNLARLYFKTGNAAQAIAFARESFDLSVEIGWREGEAMGAALLQQLGA